MKCIERGWTRITPSKHSLLKVLTMGSIPLTQDGDKLRIDGFPNAAAVVRIVEVESRRVADLRMHEVDLQFALDCLDCINPQPLEAVIIREALWRSAITHFCKCFGKNNARSFRLLPADIYKTDPEGALDAFNCFKALRDKHVVHDENSFSQATIGAILSNASTTYKVEQIVCLVGNKPTLEEGLYSNLKLLVEEALAWVRTEFHACCDQLRVELEKLDRDVLFAKPSLEYVPPTYADLFRKRQQP